MSRAVVLFDIDGTLIRRAGDHHKQALVQAVHAVTGIETSVKDVPTGGMLDRDILAEMLRRAGAPPDVSRAAMPRMVEVAQEIYGGFQPDLRRSVCPGVRHFLRRLHRENIPLGLVTGNLTSIGWKKMQCAGLFSYFRFGAFAEQADTRAGLVAIALRQARRNGWIRQDTRVSLVGDHPNDIRAAKLNGVQSVAVATGIVPRVSLKAHGPDVLLPDLRCAKLEIFL